MRKRKVTVPHPITGDATELETITLPSGESVTGYRFNRVLIEYEEPRKHSAYFESAEQEERLRQERASLAANTRALQDPIKPARKHAAKHRLSPSERLQRDIDAGNMGAVVARLRQVEESRDDLFARYGELKRLVDALLDAADARSAAGSKRARTREVDGKSVQERNAVAKTCAGELRKKNPRLSDTAIAKRIRRDLADPRSVRTIRRVIGRQSAYGQKAVP